MRRRGFDLTTFLAGSVLTLALGVAALALVALVTRTTEPATPVATAPPTPALPQLEAREPPRPRPAPLEAQPSAPAPAPARPAPTPAAPAPVSGVRVVPVESEPPRAAEPPEPVVEVEPDAEPAVAEAEPTPEPAPAAVDPSPWAGTWRGSRAGRPLELRLTLSPGGGLSGTAAVTVGPKRLESPLTGSWTLTGDRLSLQAVETEGPKPATYTGDLGVDGGGGTWSAGGRERGTWSAGR